MDLNMVLSPTTKAGQIHLNCWQFYEFLKFDGVKDEYLPEQNAHPYHLPLASIHMVAKKENNKDGGDFQVQNTKNILLKN